MKKLSTIIIGWALLFVFSYPSNARTVNMLDYAENDTVKASEVMRWMGELGAKDTLWCLDVVIKGELGYIRRDTFNRGDTIKCVLNFGKRDKNGATFSGQVSFSNAVFLSNVDFFNSRFLENADFRWTTFLGYISLEHAEVLKDVNFLGSTFSGLAYFPDARFYGITDFSQATFMGEANFLRTWFIGKACYYHTQFSSNVVLEGSVHKEATDFTETIFSEDSKIKLDDKVEFHDFKILGKQWIGKFQSEDFHGMRKFYTTLEEVFRKQARFNDMDACYLARRLLEREPMSFWGKIGDWFLWITCGYGIKPLHTILFSAFIILIFALIFSQYDAIVTKSTLGPWQSSWWDRFKDALYFSINTFTTVGYGDWYPTDENVKFFKWSIPFVKYRFVASLEGLVGWLLLALFLVTLGRIWIR
ncbi:MAG: pentapeptide repeat-containing protein [Candidatus Electryoneaceae bacterium]|nr:pentapeptide repeat-containing protein [Candidatus Electryoneaceae bacterium]